MCNLFMDYPGTPKILFALDFLEFIYGLAQTLTHTYTDTHTTIFTRFAFLSVSATNINI